MARPLNPPVVWYKDHYRFRCRVNGSRPWVDLAPGLTAGQARAQAMKIAQTARDANALPHIPKGPGPETVAQWSERWLEHRKAAGIVSTGAGTLRDHVLPLIGSLPIATIQFLAIERIVDDLDRRVVAGEMASKTAVNHWSVVTKMFDDASRSKDRAIRVRVDNPAFGIRGPDRIDPPVVSKPNQVREALAARESE